MVVQKILTHPWIVFSFLLILALLWLAARRRERRDRQIERPVGRDEKGEAEAASETLRER